MYTKDKSTLTNRVQDITRYFENYELSNSLLFKELPLISSDKSIAIKYQRFDLIAKEVYTSSEFDWILMRYTGMTNKDLVVGDMLNYPSIDKVIDLVVSLDGLMH